MPSLSITALISNTTNSGQVGSSVAYTTTDEGEDARVLKIPTTNTSFALSLPATPKASWILFMCEGPVTPDADPVANSSYIQLGFETGVYLLECLEGEPQVFRLNRGVDTGGSNTTTFWAVSDTLTGTGAGGSGDMWLRYQVYNET